MSSKFFTSDHHFGHEAIIRFSRRPFDHADEMDEEMIIRHNAVVGKNDEVYFLGDLSFHRDPYRTHAILCRLNGRKYFVRGNHDGKRFNKDIEDLFVWVKDYHELKFHGNKIVLSHYAFDVWNGSHKGWYHFHGHSHGNLKTKRYRRLDLGVDNHDFFPVELGDALALADKVLPKYQVIDHHGTRR